MGQLQHVAKQGVRIILGALGTSTRYINGGEMCSGNVVGTEELVRGAAVGRKITGQNSTTRDTIIPIF